jgi:23S rRNA (guanine2445-N2)-methyltransferase / 23S rRNA (guanine2069-N7)-methyltransferase
VLESVAEEVGSLGHDPRLGVQVVRHTDVEEVEPRRKKPGSVRATNPMPPRETFFVTCAPGVEPLLLAEARSLKLPKLESQVGGLSFTGTMRDAWRANLWLRTGIRVLRRLARFPAPDEDALYRGVAEIEWEKLLAAEGTLVVDAQAKDSELTHTRYLEQRVKDAVVDRFRARTGVRPSVAKGDADLRIHLHLSRDRATVSADTSGDSLHKRGWRRYQGRAPLAETFAAAMVLASEWDRRAPLIDPFCGSGTILVEAALLAGGVAPGLFRGAFGFERWRDHDAAGWARMRDEAQSAIVFPPRLRILGRDEDPERVAGALENVEAAELAGRVEVEVGDACELDAKPGWNAWIVTNPPFGERVGADGDLARLYERFADVLRERCGGYRLALLSGNPWLTEVFELEGAAKAPLQNGSLECHLLTLEIPRS